MIARGRGDEMRAHSRWRPAASATPPPPEPLEAHVEETDGNQLEAAPVEQARRPGRSRTLIAIAAVLVAAAVISQHHARSAPAAISLPSTPRAWVQAWTSASRDSHERACTQLFARRLAAMFKTAAGRSCSTYESSVSGRSLRVEHIFQDGPSAAIEAHQVSGTPNRGYFTVLLSHVQNGWRAVDVIPGRPLPPR